MTLSKEIIIIIFNDGGSSITVSVLTGIQSFL